MTPVLLDTVGLIALWDASDQWHSAAMPAFQALVASGRPMVTTPLILIECGNAAARRPYRMDVDDLRLEMLARNCLIEPTADDMAQAWQAYRSGPVGGPGIVDNVSFVVMRRLGITEVFSSDRHFRTAGFVTLF